jgi:hypothetical protein
MTEKLKGRDWVGIIVLAAISVSAFMGFGTFFLVDKGPADLVTELSAAAYGAIFSAVLMMLLLRKQTEHQSELAKQSQQHAKDQEIFKEQVDLFKTVVNEVEKVFNDRRITEAEIKELGFLLMRLQMLVKREETLRSFRKFYNAINDRSLEDGPPKYTDVTKDDESNFVLFLSECRLDLGLSNHDFSEDLRTDMAEDSAESIEPSSEETKEDSYSWSLRANPLALERIRELLIAVQSQPATEKSDLRYTKQYIAIVVEPAAGRKSKICTSFEPTQQSHMWVKINVPKDSALGKRVSSSFGEVDFKDGGFRFRFDLDKEAPKLKTLEGLIKEAAVSKLLGLKSEVQHRPGGNVLRWERTIRT